VPGGEEKSLLTANRGLRETCNSLGKPKGNLEVTTCSRSPKKARFKEKPVTYKFHQGEALPEKERKTSLVGSFNDSMLVQYALWGGDTDLRENRKKSVNLTHTKLIREVGLVRKGTERPLHEEKKKKVRGDEVANVRRGGKELNHARSINRQMGVQCGSRLYLKGNEPVKAPGNGRKRCRIKRNK